LTTPDSHEFDADHEKYQVGSNGLELYLSYSQGVAISSRIDVGKRFANTYPSNCPINWFLVAKVIDIESGTLIESHDTLLNIDNTTGVFSVLDFNSNLNYKITIKAFNSAKWNEDSVDFVINLKINEVINTNTAPHFLSSF